MSLYQHLSWKLLVQLRDLQCVLLHFPACIHMAQKLQFGTS